MALMEQDISVSFYPLVKGFGWLPVPAGESAALYHQLILLRILQKIMKSKRRTRILPANYLAKTQVVKYQRVIPQCNGIKLPRKLNQFAEHLRGVFVF